MMLVTTSVSAGSSRVVQHFGERAVGDAETQADRLQLLVDVEPRAAARLDRPAAARTARRSSSRTSWPPTSSCRRPCRLLAAARRAALAVAPGCRRRGAACAGAAALEVAGVAAALAAASAGVAAALAAGTAATAAAAASRRTARSAAAAPDAASGAPRTRRALRASSPPSALPCAFWRSSGVMLAKPPRPPWPPPSRRRLAFAAAAASAAWPLPPPALPPPAACRRRACRRPAADCGCPLPLRASRPLAPAAGRRAVRRRRAGRLPPADRRRRPPGRRRRAGAPPGPPRRLAAAGPPRAAGRPAAAIAAAAESALELGRHRLIQRVEDVLGRPEADRRVRHAQHVVAARDLDVDVRRHARLQLQLGIRHVDDGRVGDDVLHRHRVEPHLLDGAVERSPSDTRRRGR